MTFSASTYGILTLFCLLCSCAHHEDVRPGPEGIHKVQVQAADPEAGMEDALDQAEDFCDEKNQDYAVLNEKIIYKGTMLEADYRKGRGLAKAATVGGSAVHIFGSGQVKNVGSAAALGGIVGGAYLGNPYVIRIKFKCMK